VRFTTSDGIEIAYYEFGQRLLATRWGAIVSLLTAANETRVRRLVVDGDHLSALRSPDSAPAVVEFVGAAVKAEYTPPLHSCVVLARLQG
jgi:hypothetical protein